MHEAMQSSSEEGFRLCHGHTSSTAKLLLFTLSVVFAPAPPALATDDFYPNQQFVKYEKDSVSLAFTNLRAAEAAYLMRSTTGIAITLPTSTQTKLINLRLERAKVDHAVRSLLTALDLNNAFLLYDRDGRLTGVIALETAVETVSTPEPTRQEKRNATYRDLTVKEFDSMLRDLGRWTELSAHEQRTIHGRLKTIAPSKVRDQLIKEYVRKVLEVSEGSTTTDEDDARSTSATQARSQ
jgi:hypothetical protein